MVAKRRASGVAPSARISAVGQCKSGVLNFNQNSRPKVHQLFILCCNRGIASQHRAPAHQSQLEFFWCEWQSLVSGALVSNSAI